MLAIQSGIEKISLLIYSGSSSLSNAELFFTHPVLQEDFTQAPAVAIRLKYYIFYREWFNRSIPVETMITIIVSGIWDQAVYFCIFVTQIMV